MARRSHHNPKSREMNRRNGVIQANRSRGGGLGRRSRGGQTGHRPFIPPEDWHEPLETGNVDYRIIVQDPGPGYRHVVTPNDIRHRLAQLPSGMIESLEVVQLSRMTRKKQAFPCYGMQWGAALYLYPLEFGLTEFFVKAPPPVLLNETRMYGGQWRPMGATSWQLVWTEETIRDYYLNNVLIHELGHLLDDRNTSYADRERFAEWFAVEHGYKPGRRKSLAEKSARRITRRHHRA